MSGESEGRVSNGREERGLSIDRDNYEAKLQRSLEEQTALSQQLRAALEEQRRITDELTVKSGQLEAVFESMEEATGVWSPDGDLLSVNQATARLYGFETKEQMLKHLSEYADVVVKTMDGRALPQDEWPPSRVLRGESFSNWLLEQEIPSINKRFVGSNGGAPVRDATGAVVFGVVTVHDVTELHDARKAAEQLAEEVREKDAAIRRAYVDVIDAVTGGKLLLMTPDEIDQVLGVPVSGEREVVSGGMGSWIEWLEEMLATNFPDIPTSIAFRDACAEAMTNAVKHAGGGNCQLYRRETHVQFRVSDSGGGIDFAHLPKATLQPGYSSVGTLGIGFSAMLKDCERVRLATGQDGTTVVLEVPASGEDSSGQSE